MAKKNVTRSKAKKDAKLDAIYEDVMKCESAIPAGDVDALADIVRNNQRMGIPWRLTAALAGKDGAFFRDVAENEETAKTFATLVDPLRDFAEMLRKVAELADCAACRVMVAGCNHEKFNDWVKEAA